MLCLVAQSCPTLCDPRDCSLPGSSVHGILWATILEWVAMPSSRASSPPRDWTWVSRITGRFFTIWATREARVRSGLSIKKVSYCQWKQLFNQAKFPIQLAYKKHSRTKSFNNHQITELVGSSLNQPQFNRLWNWYPRRETHTRQPC